MIIQSIIALQLTNCYRDSRHWIRDAKFTPDGKSFATASMDHKIYIYSRENYRLKGTCSRHNSSIRGFDFSADSAYLQSDSSDYEHLYFEVQDGEHFSAGSQLRDIGWADWTCCFGWPVQGNVLNYVWLPARPLNPLLVPGIWPRMEDVAKGLTMDPNCVHRSPDQQSLAVGSADGAVRLFRYPCASKEVHLVSKFFFYNML